MRRLYRLHLQAIGDDVEDVIFDDGGTFATFDDDTTNGETDVFGELRRMLAAMWTGYFEEEKKRVDFWESQVKLCERRLQGALSPHRKMCLEGALKTFHLELEKLTGGEDDGPDRS